MINIRWTFNLVYFVDRAIHEFKIPTKNLYTWVILHIIWNPQIQVFTNMFNVDKPWNFMPMKLNNFTVVWELKYQQTICQTIQNDVKSNKKCEMMPHHNTKHQGPIRDWIFCVTLAMRTFNVWHNMLSRIYRSIRHQFKSSFWYIKEEKLVLCQPPF